MSIGLIFLGVMSITGVASHGGEGNFTLQPESLEGESWEDDENFDRYPRYPEATYDMFVRMDSDYNNIESIVYEPDSSFRDCGAGDVEKFGADRGSDNKGTEVDESFMISIGAYQSNQSHIVVKFRTPPDLSADDTLVLRIENCILNPQNSGWYNTEFSLTDSGNTAAITSHYYGICECNNESQAREELGSPPSESTPTPSLSPTPTPTSTPTPSQSSTPALTDSPTPTDTVELNRTDHDTTSPTEEDGAGFGILVIVMSTIILVVLMRRAQESPAS